jgi:hypothetical protein
MTKKIFKLIEYKRRSETWPDCREGGEEMETEREALQIAGEVNG